MTFRSVRTARMCPLFGSPARLAAGLLFGLAIGLAGCSAENTSVETNDANEVKANALTGRYRSDETTFHAGDVFGIDIEGQSDGSRGDRERYGEYTGNLYFVAESCATASEAGTCDRAWIDAHVESLERFNFLDTSIWKERITGEGHLFDANFDFRYAVSGSGITLKEGEKSTTLSRLPVTAVSQAARDALGSVLVRNKDIPRGDSVEISDLPFEAQREMHFGRNEFSAAAERLVAQSLTFYVVRVGLDAGPDLIKFYTEAGALVGYLVDPGLGTVGTFNTVEY